MHNPGAGEYGAAAPRPPARPALRAAPSAARPGSGSSSGLGSVWPREPGPARPAPPTPPSVPPTVPVPPGPAGLRQAPGLGWFRGRRARASRGAPTSARPGAAAGPREGVGGPGPAVQWPGVPSPPFAVGVGGGGWGETDQGTREGGAAAAAPGGGGAPGGRFGSPRAKGRTH